MTMQPAAPLSGHSESDRSERPAMPGGEPFGLTRSIIHKCPALKVPQTFLQKLGNMAQIIPLHGASDELAQAIVDRLNARHAAAELVSAAAAQVSAPADAVWIVYYDDHDRRPEVLIGEAAARARFQRISDNWNAHLFVKVASNCKDDRYANANVQLAPVPAPVSAAVAAPARTPMDVIKEWAERHDIHGSDAALRAIFEDAQTAAVAAPTGARDVVELMLLAATDLAGWAKQYGDGASKDTAERLREAALATPAQAVPQRLPVTEDAMLHLFSTVDSPTDAELLRAEAAGKQVDTVAWLGARHGFRAFERAVRAAEFAHGIVAIPAQQDGEQR